MTISTSTLRITILWLDCSTFLSFERRYAERRIFILKLCVGRLSAVRQYVVQLYVMAPFDADMST